MMRSLRRSALFMLGAGCVLAGAAAAEEVSLPTYYPSPRGEYEQLRVHDNALLALEGGDVGIGTGGGAVRAMLDVHGEAAAQLVGLAADAGWKAQTWWLGSLSGDSFNIEGVDTIRGNYVPASSPPQLGGISHASVTVTHAEGNVGVGNFSLPLPPKTPLNRLDIRGAAVVGDAYAGVVTAPGDGLLVEDKTGVSLPPGLQALNRLDIGGRAAIGAGYVGGATPPANSLVVQGATGVGITSGTPLANKLEVNGPAVVGPNYAGTVDLATVSGTFTVNLGVERQTRTTSSVKAPPSGTPIAFMGPGAGWAFGVIAGGASAGAQTDGTGSALIVCNGSCVGGGPSTNVFEALSSGVVKVKDTVEFESGPKTAGLKPGAGLVIATGAVAGHVLVSNDASGRAVWKAPSTPGLQGAPGTTPSVPPATRPIESLLRANQGSVSCGAGQTFRLLFEGAGGSMLFGCTGQ